MSSLYRRRPSLARGDGKGHRDQAYPIDDHSDAAHEARCRELEALNGVRPVAPGQRYDAIDYGPDEETAPEVCMSRADEGSLGYLLEGMIARANGAGPKAPSPAPTPALPKQNALAAPAPDTRTKARAFRRRLFAALTVQDALEALALPKPDSDDAVRAGRQVARVIVRALHDAHLRIEHLDRKDAKALIVGTARRNGWKPKVLALDALDRLRDTVLPEGMDPVQYAAELAERRPKQVLVPPVGDAELHGLAQRIADLVYHLEHLGTEEADGHFEPFTELAFLSCRSVAAALGVNRNEANLALRLLKQHDVLHELAPPTTRRAGRYTADYNKALWFASLPEKEREALLRRSGRNPEAHRP